MPGIFNRCFKPCSGDSPVIHKRSQKFIMSTYRRRQTTRQRQSLRIKSQSIQSLIDDMDHIMDVPLPIATNDTNTNSKKRSLNTEKRFNLHIFQLLHWLQ